MKVTKQELKEANNNVISVIEDRIMALINCNRRTANLVANEVLEIDREAEWILSQSEAEEE